MTGHKTVAPGQRMEGYSLIQQLQIWSFVSALVLSSFLPYMLDMEMYDGEPEVPYNGAVDDVTIRITNAVLTACTSMMMLEILLDSNTLYIPIKIAFPRFVMVLGVLIISLLPYFLDIEPGLDRLNFHACSMFAKGYFVVTGLAVQLLRDAAPDKNAYTARFYGYMAVVVLFTTNYQLHQWNSYVEPSSSYRVAMDVIGVLSVIVSLYFVFRMAQLALTTDHGGFASPHYYELMSHGIVCLFFFGTYCVVLTSSAMTWKDYTVRELVSYQYIDLGIIVIFFFTSSYIAQRNFVSARGQLATKKYFVRYISHEIRTPLNTVHMGMQLLAEEIEKVFAPMTAAAGRGALESCKSILNDISESVSISINILNDLLLIDKIEEGTISLDMNSACAQGLFESCIRHFDVQAQFSQVALTTDLRALRGVVLLVDEMKIAQVIRNTVSNALKFTPRGGHIHVKASFSPDSDAPAPPSPSSSPRFSSAQRTAPNERGRIRVEFLDTGPGIAEVNKQKLFKNVVQFSPNELQQGGGSGLGLYISHAIMQRHPGGVIGVMPGGVEVLPRRPGEGPGEEEGGGVGGVQLLASECARSGCVFFMELPGYKCADEAVESPAALRSGFGEYLAAKTRAAIGGTDSNDVSSNSVQYLLGGDGDGANCLELRSVQHSSDAGTAGPEHDCGSRFSKVLVVEDSKLNRKMMGKVLAPHCDQVVMAEDGAEGVSAVRQCLDRGEAPFDVIFMDSLMPNMNGIDATKAILRELKFPNPIVAVTGNMLPDDVAEFENAGVLAVLGKPLDLGKLQAVLDDIHFARMAREHQGT